MKNDFINFFYINDNINKYTEITKPQVETLKYLYSFFFWSFLDSHRVKMYKN